MAHIILYWAPFQQLSLNFAAINLCHENCSEKGEREENSSSVFTDIHSACLFLKSVKKIKNQNFPLHQDQEKLIQRKSIQQVI